MDQIRGKITDELWILTFFETWYAQQVNALCNWLSERLDHGLHYYQCAALSHMVKVSIIYKKKLTAVTKSDSLISNSRKNFTAFKNFIPLLIPFLCIFSQ